MESMMGRIAVWGALCLAAACSKNGGGDVVIDPDAPFDGTVKSMGIGDDWERGCGTGDFPEVKHTIGATACLVDFGMDAIVVYTRKADAAGAPGDSIVTVRYGGLSPGVHSSKDDTGSFVILQGSCSARSSDTEEPCYVELLSLVRGNTPATGGAVESGSSVNMRVACPAEMRWLGDDFEVITKQKPQRFEVEATDCTVQ